MLLAGSLAAVCALAALLGGSAAHAEPDASRVIDRTFVCAVKLRAGARRIEAQAWSGFRDPVQQPRWKWLPRADLGAPDVDSFVWMSAGAPPPKPDQGAGPITRWLGVYGPLCKLTNENVALSSGGLEGGAASQLQYSDEYECPTPARILIRVRATFDKPVTFAAQRFNGRPWYTGTAGAPVEEGVFAVATEAGKPLVFATVSETGKASLFVARRCTPE